MSEGWQDRLRDELGELSGRLSRLADFIQSPQFQKLPDEECFDLVEQAAAMRIYEIVLTRRISRLPATKPQTWKPGER